MKILQGEITETQTSFSTNFGDKLTLEPCALNAEFQHLILRFNKISFTLRIPLKEGIGGESRPKDRVTLQITVM
jgi:hypothetical protein